MSIAIEGLKDVVRRKTFSDIAEGTSFVGSFRGEFGVWHKAHDLTVVRMNERGWLDVFRLNPKRNEQYASVFNYTKVNLCVRVESVSESPGGR